MDKIGIFTLPLSPSRSEQIARFVPPIVGETIGKALNGNFYLCINMLDSYNDRTNDLLTYKKKESSLSIDKYKMWLDSDHIEELKSNIYLLIKKGYIQEKHEKIYCCPCCGKTEIAEKNLKTINPNKKGFTSNENSIVCNFCHEICELHYEKVLVFSPNNIKLSDIKFFPNYLNKDIKTFELTVNNSSNVISRRRNTGFVILYNDSYYNIDIDFLWQVYLSLFNENEKVVVCGNKELYQMYLTGILDKILSPNSKTLFVGIPIINDINKYISNVSSKNDILDAKLAIIFNITWGAKVRNFDYQLFDKLNRIPYERKLEIYNEVINSDTMEDNFYQKVCCILENCFNYQKTVKKLKKR